MPKRRYDTAATRAELLASARTLFAASGYAAAKTEDIVAHLGLTRGALYHHFASKAGLFEAVVEDLQAELTAEVNRRAVRAAPNGLVEGLRAGFQAYLDLAARPDVARIVMVDGPAVLGWERWRDIDLRHAFGATRAALARAVAAGEVDAPVPLDELTQVLLGAVTHAALEIGRAAKPRVARRNYAQAIDLLIERLRPSA